MVFDELRFVFSDVYCNLLEFLYLILHCVLPLVKHSAEVTVHQELSVSVSLLFIRLGTSSRARSTTEQS